MTKKKYNIWHIDAYSGRNDYDSPEDCNYHRDYIFDACFSKQQVIDMWVATHSDSRCVAVSKCYLVSEKTGKPLKRYRYIVSENAQCNKKISNYRLFEKIERTEQHLWIRVRIPDDMKISSWKENISRTYDERSIKDMEYDCFYYDTKKNKTVKANYLKEYPISEWADIIETKRKKHVTDKN